MVALGEPTLDLCLLGLWCKIKGTELMHFIKKNALYMSVNVFSTKVLIGDTIFYVS